MPLLLLLGQATSAHTVGGTSQLSGFGSSGGLNVFTTITVGGASQLSVVTSSGGIAVGISTKGGQSTDDKIRIQHQKMLRKQLHLKKQPVEFDILVKEDGEVEIDGVIVPVELVSKIPKRIQTLPKLITQDDVVAEIALLSREREIKTFNQSVIKFQAAIKAANDLEEEMKQMEEELLVMLLASTLD